jgi:protoporphyrinogen oxidase
MPGLRWDRFYHVILSTDEKLLDFISHIGLSLDVQFRETKTGFYTNGQLYSMSSTMEFLRFKPLSLWNKFRLGVGIIYASKINDSSRLEKMYAKTWLIRVFGRRIYEELWEPLLRSKLGSAASMASGSFIWAIIKRYYGTRHKSSKKELMGCVRGGYYSILNSVQSRLLERGVKVLLNHDVEKMEQLDSGRLRIYCNNGKIIDFDRIISTVPNPQIIRLWQDMPGDLKSQLQKVSYLSLICVTLVLKKSLCPFYVTNITDDGFPFTGVIEATNVVPPEILKDKGLIYLPRYMPPDDPFLRKSDSEVVDIFFKALCRIFPNLSEDDVIAKRVHRKTHVQPIQEVDYSKNIPSMKTSLENFFIANTTMILNSTLNNNQVIHLSRKAAACVVNGK